MRVATWFSPDRYAGSTVTARALAHGLEQLGHWVTHESDYAAADVLLAHLDDPPALVELARRHLLPIAVLVRHPSELRYISAHDVALAVFPSDATRTKARRFDTQRLTVRPPIWVRDYRLPPADLFGLNPDAALDPTPRRITLVNGTSENGAGLVYELARRCPHRLFLVVRGTGRQMPPPPLRNLEVVGPVDDIRDVYARTRVLLMPGVQTYGRPAVEAACSGIPTIAANCQASLETLRSAALWASRERIHEWLGALHRLDDPRTYSAASSAAFTRAVQLDPTEGIARLQRALHRIRRSAASSPPPLSTFDTSLRV